MLSLVLYGINLSTLKMSTGVIFMVGIIIGADYFNADTLVINTNIVEVKLSNCNPKSVVNNSESNHPHNFK